MPLTKAEARKIALSLHGASEGSHYGKPSIFAGGNFLCRVHHKEDAMVLLTGSVEMRDVMLEAEPTLFYITDHYKNYPAILARLEALDRKMLKDLLAASVSRREQKAAKKRAGRAIKKSVKKIAKKRKRRA
jgi:hypothetical protein